MPVFGDQGMAHSPVGMLRCGTNEPRAQAAGEHRCGTQRILSP